MFIVSELLVSITTAAAAETPEESSNAVGWSASGGTTEHADADSEDDADDQDCQ